MQRASIVSACSHRMEFMHSISHAHLSYQNLSFRLHKCTSTSARTLNSQNRGQGPRCFCSTARSASSPSASTPSARRFRPAPGASVRSPQPPQPPLRQAFAACRSPREDEFATLRARLEIFRRMCNRNPQQTRSRMVCAVM